MVDVEVWPNILAIREKMTDSESKFRNQLKKIFIGSESYIKKMPDKKQLAAGALIGLPDYLVIHKGKTSWFEVKQVKNKKYNVHMFNLNNISDTQWIEFTAMRNAGATIFIAIYLNKELFVVPFENIQFAKFIGGETSIHQDTLNKWRIKWSQE